MFRWDIFQQFLFSSVFLQAAWTTLWISVAAQSIGVVLGLFLALMRMSRFPSVRLPLLSWRLPEQDWTGSRFFRGKPVIYLSEPRPLPVLSWLARAYIWFFRGSPLLVQVLLLFDGLPRLFPDLPPLADWLCVLIAFSLNEGAYMSEIVRAGITSVDTGQMEAAKSLGMHYWLAMRRIILPQAARVIVPPLGNEFNNMLKTTSIASVIGLLELTNAAETFGAPSFSTFELLLVATLYYLLLTTIWGIFQSWLEKSMDPNRDLKIELNQKGLANRVFGFSFNRSGTGSR